jgi:catechol 2,3-dioxygenase-like lactoylglutathione lyase family enzyme
VRDLVGGLLAEDPADVVVSHLDAGAGALAAAHEAAVPGLLLLAGYDPLCKQAVAGDGRCVPASRCRACPSTLDLPEDERTALLRMRARQDAALSAAACVVAPSHAMASACERIFGCRPEVAAPVVRAPAPAVAAPAGDVLFVSSLWTRQKGVELVAPIASRLSDRSVVVRAPNGFPDEHRRALTTLPNVTLDESASEVGQLLKGASVLLLPAQQPEPFGRLAFEAMAAGVPTLASATGGLPEFVPAEQLVRDFENADAWASAVRALERRSEWDAARRRGKGAAEHVLASDPPAQIERWLGRAVVEARGATPARPVPERFEGICEVSLETADLGRLERFYRTALGLEVIRREPDRIWLACGSRARLGIWSPGAKEFGDRGGRHVHFALSASHDKLDDVMRRLDSESVEYRGPVEHPGGDRSVYVEDPEGNVAEVWDFRWRS